MMEGKLEPVEYALWKRSERLRAVPAEASGTSPGYPVLCLCDAVKPTWEP